MTPRHSLSAHLFAREPLAFGHLRLAAEAGFQGVELWAMRPHFDFTDPGARARLCGWLKDLSLRPLSFHAPFYAHLDEARAGRWLSLAAPEPARRRAAVGLVLEAMRALGETGARTAVLHPCAPGAAGEDDSREALRASLGELLPAAEAAGMTLALENIPARLGTLGEVAAAVAEMDHPRLRACLDTGHARLTEGDAPFIPGTPAAPGAETTGTQRTGAGNPAGAGLARFLSLCAATHLHDNDGETDAHRVPGEGCLPWEAIGRAIAESGYAGPLTYEVRADPGEGYAAALDRLARAARGWAPRAGQVA